MIDKKIGKRIPRNKLCIRHRPRKKNSWGMRVETGNATEPYFRRMKNPETAPFQQRHCFPPVAMGLGDAIVFSCILFRKLLLIAPEGKFERISLFFHLEKSPKKTILTRKTNSGEHVTGKPNEPQISDVQPRCIKTRKILPWA